MLGKLSQVHGCVNRVVILKKPDLLLEAFLKIQLLSLGTLLLAIIAEKKLECPSFGHKVCFLARGQNGAPWTLVYMKPP